MNNSQWGKVKDEYVEGWQQNDPEQQYDQQGQNNQQNNPQLNSIFIVNSQLAQSVQSTAEIQIEKQIEQDQTEQITEKEYEIFCPDHPEQIIKYIILYKDIPKNMSRLACSECIANKKAPFSNYCCILEDLYNDEMAILKYANFYLFLQRFCNLYYKNEPRLYQQPEELIKRIFKQFKQLFIYRLEEMEKTLIKQATEMTNYKTTLEELEKLKKDIKVKIDKQKLFEAINQFKRAEKLDIDINVSSQDVVDLDYIKLLSYQLEMLNSQVNEFVQTSLYDEKTIQQLKKYESQFDKIQNQQTEFYNQHHLRATTEKIFYQLDQLKYVFDKKLLTKSELADNFLNKIITQEQADKSVLIYRSSKDGLDYRIIQGLSDSFLNQQALFIFETYTAQTFGVYVDVKNPKKSLIFQMTKRHKYQCIDTQNIIYFNQEALSSDPLFIFGGQDLVIQANMVNCTSNLGKGFEIELQKQFIRHNSKGYLGNAENFSIKNMEILVFE